MIDGIEEYSRRIAESIVGAVPEGVGWNSAKFKALFFADGNTSWNEDREWEREQKRQRRLLS